jgi:hypothetical protein
MKGSPLLLSLVIINFALVAFMFYTNNQVLAQRQDALTRIVDWQQRTDSLMASCVSIDVMKLVVDALERDRALYRQMLPPLPGQSTHPETPPQPKLQHLLPPDQRTELERREVNHVVLWPPLPLPRPSTAPREPVPADDGK